MSRIFHIVILYVINCSSINNALFYNREYNNLGFSKMQKAREFNNATLKLNRNDKICVVLFLSLAIESN